MTTGDVVAIIIWCLPSAVAIWQSAREKRQAMEWGPRPKPPAFTRWMRCSECWATYAHEVLLSVRESALCKRCKEQERLPL